MSLTFYPRWRSTLAVARRSGMTGPTALALSTLPGRLAWVAYLRRRVPAQALRVRRASAGEPAVTFAAPGGPYRGAVAVVAGPGELEPLAELVASIRAYEGEDIKIVVADDATGEYPDALVRERLRGVDFVRARIPGGNASCSFRTQQLAFLHIIAHYDVPVVLKLDPDALVIDAGSFDQAHAAFTADPSLGILGTTDRDATGAPTDYRFTSWIFHPELRWSGRMRRLLSLARARVGRLSWAQGGAYFLAGAALRAAQRERLLPFRQPAWSLLTEDAVTALVIQAAGFSVGSFGAPGQTIASATTALPIEPEEAVSGGFKVVHSVRGTPSGLDERAVRAFFAARRPVSPRSTPPAADVT